MPYDQNTASCNMEEKDMLNDLLNTEKQIIGMYSTAVIESSCPNMRQVLSTNLTEVFQDQYQIFDTMRTKNYYQTKDAADTDVTQAKQKFAQIQTQLT